MPRLEVDVEKEKTKAVSSSSRAGPGLRPKYSAEDFKTVAAKIRYDLSSAQAKLTELANMLTSLDLPSEERVFNEDRAIAFVKNTAHEYTDSSLADELALQGADRGFIDRALLVAAEVRRK